MRITDIKISEFSISDNTPFFKLKNKNGSWEKYDIKKKEDTKNRYNLLLS